MSSIRYVERIVVHIKKRVRNYLLDFYRWGCVRYPRPILRVLMYFGWDIWLFSIPYLLLHNLKNINKLRKLKKSGYSPAIVFYSAEGDGRFDRLYDLSMNAGNLDSVWFVFPIETVSAESVIFQEHTRRGCGFYEDARMKYIDPVNDSARSLYRNYIERFFAAIEISLGKVNFFFSGSNHDRYVVEMIYVAQQRGIEWIVAEREGTGTPFTYLDEARCYKESKTVTADYFITANKGHHYMFEHSRMPSVKDIFIVGDLDTDWWFHWNRNFLRSEYGAWQKYSKKVLFLTFGIRNYVSPYSFPNNPEFNWITLLKEAEDEIFDFALNNPDVLVFYKMGHIEDNNPIFIQRCVDADLKNVVPLDRSFPCNELILFSDLVIGFQTTAMYEAMFSEVPLIYLEWAIHPELDRNTMLLPLANSGACITAKSKSEFRDLLERWKSGDPDLVVSEDMRERRKDVRETMFNNSDGYVAERVFTKFNELLKIQLLANNQKCIRN